MSSEHEMDETPHEDVVEESASHEEGGDETHAADADFTDEEWSAEGEEGAVEDDHDHEGDGGEGSSPKKKKMKMNMMIIGGAVVIGLGAFYMLMSKKSVRLPPPTAQEAPVPAAPPTDNDMIYGAPKDAETPAKVDKNKLPMKGLLDDPSAIKKVQKMSDSHVVTAEELTPETPNATPSLVPKEVKSAPPMPAPISQGPQPQQKSTSGPLTPMPQEEKGTPFAAVAAATPPAPVKAAPAQPAAEKAPNPAWPAPAAEKPVKPAVPETAATTTVKAPDLGKPAAVVAAAPFAAPANTGAAAPSPAAMQGSAASGETLDRIASKLDGIESELKTLQDSSVRKDELADLKAQLGSLQDKVNNISAQGVRPSAATPVSEKPVHTTHTAHKTAVAVSHHKSTPVVSSWTLKSAQPNMAIVAKGDGQMVTVRTGDKLNGLGRIKSIGEEKGRWVVRGTAGILTQ